MENKKPLPGQTMYLKPGESFGDVKTLSTLEAEMLKNMPAPIPVAINSKGEVIPEPQVVEPKPAAVVKEEVKVEEVVIAPAAEIKEEAVAKTTLSLAKKMLQKNKEEKEAIGPAIPMADLDLPKLEEEVEVDLFSDLDEIEERIAKQEQEPIEEEKPRSKAKVVDLNKIKVINKNELDKERDLRSALYGNKAAFQIVAAQSGYMAKVLPLVHKDIMDILRENLNIYERQKSLFYTVWEKIYDTSIGKMNFENWLQNTSVEDMETFYYGIYASTFPNEGSFRFTCPACEAERDYKVNHGNLIKTTDSEHMKKLIDKVSREASSAEKMREFSLIGKNQAIQLSQTNIIVELRTPSLMDLLEILKTVPEKTIDKDSKNIVYMLYVNRLLIPSKDGSTYFEEYKKPAILRVIDTLPIDDANEFKDAVDERIDENRITYSIKNIKCSECGHEVNEVPLSVENILFTLIFEKAQY